MAVGIPHHTDDVPAPNRASTPPAAGGGCSYRNPWRRLPREASSSTRDPSSAGRSSRSLGRSCPYRTQERARGSNPMIREPEATAALLKNVRRDSGSLILSSFRFLPSSGCPTDLPRGLMVGQQVLSNARYGCTQGSKMFRAAVSGVRAPALLPSEESFARIRLVTQSTREPEEP